MQYQCLAILSFADDHILAIENMVENIFPPSTHLFNGIDKLVYNAEYLPGRFDDAMNAIPIIMHQVPFLDWVVMHLISWLNFLISTLMNWGSKNTQEKDIMIDIVCNNPGPGLDISMDKAASHKENDEFPSMSTSHPSREMAKEFESEKGCVQMPKIAQCQLNEDTESPPELSKGSFYKPFQDEMRCSYKEMLEKGTKGNAETNEDNHNNSQFETPRSTISEGGVEIDREKDLQESIAGFDLDDPILELYEASWHLK
ncbi:unnamed protein product [Coffea canephora]|uniref:Uncharacterized protein n=1 Tax=Coffea canephora TaxID=49390 RepID=A0A068UYK3_COFCA|nr:unnamed protein product [Coffea canephora]